MAVATRDWRSRFPNYRLNNLGFFSSDHCPIILQPCRDHIPPPNRCFRFENAWLNMEECCNVISSNWTGSDTYSMIEKMSRCSQALLRWGVNFTGQFRRRLKFHKEKMVGLMRGRREASSEFFKARDEYYDILNQQEIYWKQRAKTFWLKDGDRNSKYFHAQASHRRKNNSIIKLMDEEGVWRTLSNGLQEMFASYFRSLYNS